MGMTPTQARLWAGISTHPLDDPRAPLTFTARLARENGWSIARAVRVVEEYRRFVLLAVTVGEPMTPSEDVDQVWHLHLVYTRDYWNAFCGGVLGVPLHHGPTRGGGDEARRFDAQYAGTLAAYRAVFGVDPPADIWPAAERRFGDDLAWRRVNTRRNWVIPRPGWLRLPGRRRPAAGRGSPPGAVTPQASLLPLAAFDPLDLRGPEFLGLFGAVMVVALVVGWLIRRWLLPPGDDRVDGRPLEPLELALLANDGRLRFAAIGVAEVAGAEAGGAIPEAIDPRSSEVVRRLHTCLLAAGPSGTVATFQAALAAAKEEESLLVERGLLLDWTQWCRSPALWVALVPAAAAFALGVAKVRVGIAREKPIEFLGILLGLLLLLAFLFLARRPRRTRRGEEALREARQRFIESGEREQWLRRRAEPDAAALAPLAVAVLGVATLHGTALAGFATLAGAARRQGHAGDSSMFWYSGYNGYSSDSSGDSGGDSGGGGCGGCGGCGGGGD